MRSVLFYAVAALVLLTIHDLTKRGELIAASIVTMGYIIQMALTEIRDAIRERKPAPQADRGEG